MIPPVPPGLADGPPRGDPRGTAAERLLVVGAMASSVLGDLGDVFTAVMGFAQLLGGEVASRTPAGSYARHIWHAGRRGQALAERLVGYARSAGGGPARVDLRGVVDVAVDLARPLLGRRVRLCVEHAPGDLSVWADPDDLEQVVLALLLNARDGLPSGGRLEVRTQRRPPAPDGAPAAAALWVRDHGLARASDAPSAEALDEGHGGPESLVALRRLAALLRRNGGRLEASADALRGHGYEVRLPCAA